MKSCAPPSQFCVCVKSGLTISIHKVKNKEDNPKSTCDCSGPSKSNCLTELQ